MSHDPFRDMTFLSAMNRPLHNPFSATTLWGQQKWEDFDLETEQFNARVVERCIQIVNFSRLRLVSLVSRKPCWKKPR